MGSWVERDLHRWADLGDLMRDQIVRIEEVGAERSFRAVFALSGANFHAKS